MSLHDVAYDRFGVVRTYGSHVPALGLTKVAASSVIEQLRIHGVSSFPLFCCIVFLHLVYIFCLRFYYCTIILFSSYILFVVSGVSVVSVSSALSPPALLFPFSILVSLLPLLLFPLLFLLLRLFLPLLFLFIYSSSLFLSILCFVFLFPHPLSLLLLLFFRLLPAALPLFLCFRSFCGRLGLPFLFILLRLFLLVVFSLLSSWFFFPSFSSYFLLICWSSCFLICVFFSSFLCSSSFVFCFFGFFLILFLFCRPFLSSLLSFCCLFLSPVFFFLLLFFFCFLSVFPLSVVFAMCSIASRSFVHEFLRSVGFVFVYLFFSPL